MTRLTRPGRARSVAGLDAEVGEQGADTSFDLVADGADRLDALAGRVVELPVEVALAGEVRAGVVWVTGPGREPWEVYVVKADAESLERADRQPGADSLRQPGAESLERAATEADACSCGPGR